MRPIVDGLKQEYGDRVLFVYLNVGDRAQGLPVFQKLGLPGHPSYAIFRPDGTETYRGFGIVKESLLKEQIEAVIDQR